MKKLILNINDLDYEKFMFEAIHEEKSIQEIVKERLFHKPFAQEVLEAYEKRFESGLNKLLEE